MIFIENIDDLWYYRKQPQETCWCWALVYPNDLLLQDVLNTGYNSGFSVEVFVYSPDGKSSLEDATAYFSFYVGIDTIGRRFFNLRCEEFSPAMCSNKCYILRVKVYANAKLIFDKYTEQYCQTDCCDIPRGIGWTTAEGEEPTFTEDTEIIPTINCGTPIIRIRTIFDCIDNETGKYYGLPSTVLTGTANFSYEKIFNFAGKIRQGAREITRIVSYNCELQRSESFKPYIVEGNSLESLLPDWALNELENMLHASYIEVNDYGILGKREYQFTGGTIGERIWGCFNTFRINFTLQSCTVRTDFGCGECETITAQSFLVPIGGNGLFYTENKQLIGDFDDLVAYYQSMGFTVTNTSGTYDNTSYSFTAQGNGLLPPFYYDSPIQKNKVYGTTVPVAPDISCLPMVIGLITFEDATCAPFDTGMITFDSPTSFTADVIHYGDWGVEGDVVVSDGTGLINITAVNATITMPQNFVGEPIAVINYPAKPTLGAAIDLGGGRQITIDSSGVIRFYGDPDSVDVSGTTIILTNVYYQI